ncbi:MAG: hypothetical protein EP329_15370 [Deltaproteobacteria bacterium]|nr:MAG: hypothetical protein EP329_15370 [Deltaproteobacteria bacterium]
MRRSLLLLVAPLALASMAACGDSGGTAVDCNLNPTLPACQGVDAVGDVVADVSADVNEACSGSARRCSGSLTQQCISGVWTDLFRCPVSQTCQEGFCVGGSGCSCDGKVCGDDGCGNSCGSCASNATCEAGQCVITPACTCGGAVCGFDNCGNSCGTCPSGQTCNGGQCSGGTTTCSCGGALCGYDNCGNLCGTCQSGWTCSGGTCVETGTTPTGVGTCVDILDCIFSSCADLPDPQASTCQEACYTAGNATGQYEFDAFIGCANDCGSDDFCFADYCSDDQAACYFDASGPGGCFDILDCMDYCYDGDDACIYGCYEASTLAAQAALLGLNNCLSAACPDATDDVCFYDAIDYQCADHVYACQMN